MKHSRLNPVSDKRRKELNEYRKVREQFLHENRQCEAGLIFAVQGIDTGCTKEATEIHHSAKRRGRMLCDTSKFVATCHACHMYLESNKKLARELGLLENF